MFLKSHLQYFLLFKNKFLHLKTNFSIPVTIPECFLLSSHMGKEQSITGFLPVTPQHCNLPALVPFKIVVSGVLSFSTVYIEKLLIEILLRKCVGSH